MSWLRDRLFRKRRLLEVDRLGSFEEFREWRQRKAPEMAEQAAFRRSLLGRDDAFTFPGYCYCCQRLVGFHIHCSGQDEPNWRESALCPRCGLNTRMRYSMQCLIQLEHAGVRSRIYAPEQTTPLFRWMSGRFPRLIGSEFLGSSVPLGEKNADGIRNEDLTRLTLPDSSQDFVASFECLEHIPEYKSALSELCRVLRQGGTLLLTAPFSPESEKTLVRASVSEKGEIIHHLPPEYHGDPLSDAGCLAYYRFGWDLLESVRAAGFRQAQMGFLWDREFAYLHDYNCLLIAKK